MKKYSFTFHMLLFLPLVLIFYCINKRAIRQTNSIDHHKQIDSSNGKDSAKVTPHKKESIHEVVRIQKSDFRTYTIPIPHWVGKKFRFLEKTKMFQKFGYELYTTPLFAQETRKEDPAVALANHRINYNRFKGLTATVLAVKLMNDGEYIISFKTDTLNHIVYGKTKRGVIEGIALYDDYALAEKRWKSKIIYSKRRGIDIFDSLTSRFQTEKVSITEPLTVIAIRWGITPLPPRSLWLIVRRKDNLQGLIPIHYSWTNVLREKEVNGWPWESEIFEKDPCKTYDWDDFVWQAIDKHTIFIGMTTEQVRVSWGEPDFIQYESKEDKKKCIFQYQGKSVGFVNDTLRFTSEL